MIDNASSHFAEMIARLCDEMNLLCVPLPSGTTWLTQPCDVALFRPLKQAWKAIVDDYNAGRGRRQVELLPKSEFTIILDRLIDEMKKEDRLATNIRSGFRKTGLYPFNREIVLAREYSTLLYAIFPFPPK